MNHIAAKAAPSNPQVQPSGQLGERPRLEWLPLDKLVVDDRYQRKVSADGNTLINRIVRTFDWSKFQPLTVTGPDASGDYPVIDGQHRLEACRRHPLVAEAPCWIVAAPKIADQAQAFIAVNKARIGVTRINVFWAALAAGDADAQWIKRICDAAGIMIGRAGTGRQPPLTTIALAALLKLRPLGDDAIIRGLKLIAEAQPEAENAFRNATITALVRLTALRAEIIELERLRQILTDMDFDDQIEKARIYRQTFQGTIEAALLTVLVRAYNRGLREDRRLPEGAA